MSKAGNIIQPFAFTGYQEDEVSGLKFAQARYYNSAIGRFVGEDQVRGNIENPETQNHYLYCRNDPEVYIDKNGKNPSAILPGIWSLAALDGPIPVGDAIAVIATVAVLTYVACTDESEKENTVSVVDTKTDDQDVNLHL